MRSHPHHRPVPLAPLALLGIAAIGGCAFTESATEVTFGRGHLPLVKADLAFPTLEELVGDALPDPGGPDAHRGLPSTLERTTLAHVMGLMAMTGRCQRVHEQAEVTGDDPEQDSGLANLRVTLTQCPEGDRCRAYCGPHRGMIARFGVDMRFVGQETVSDLNTRLSADVRDAIAQVRLQISDLTPVAVYDGESANVLAALDAFDVALGDDQGHTLPLLRREHIELFAQGGSTRVELPPEDAVTERVMTLIEASQEVVVRLIVRIEIATADLYAWRLSGSSLRLRAQPEIVIRTFSLVASAL